MIEKVISIRRVTKVVKGGRVMRFSALVVVGDQQGSFGIGKSKAKETMTAIQKAITKAKKNLIKIESSGGTVAYAVIGKFGSSKVLLMPTTKGKGIVANYSVRTLLDIIGLKNITAKCYGSTNPVNVVLATMRGLVSQEGIESVSSRRGMSPLRLV